MAARAAVAVGAGVSGLTVAAALGLIALLFVGVVALQEVGRRVGLGRRRVHGAPEGVAAIEGAAFALLGLLMAFTFNGAATRFEGRRQLIVQESNALGTAWLRLDLLPAAAQPHVRDEFRGYLDHRLAAYRAVPDLRAARAHLDSAGAHQAALWAGAVAAAQQVSGPAALAVLPPLNESFDIASARLAAAQMHPPVIIWALLGVLTVLCCLLAGFDMSAAPRRSWLHILGLAVLLTVTLYVIVDFEYPRVGLIRVAGFDQLLVDLRATMR